MAKERKLLLLLLLLGLRIGPIFGQVENVLFNSSFLSHSFFQAGKQKLIERQFDSAVIFFKRALNTNDTQDNTLIKAICLLEIAHAYAADGIIDSAEIYLRKINPVRKNFTHLPKQFLKEFYFLKGHILYFHNNPDSAEIYLNKALIIQTNPPPDSLNTLILKDLGNTSLIRFNYDEAMKLYSEAMDYENLRDRPDDLIISSLYQNLSIVYAKMFKYEEAVKCVNKSISIKERILFNDDILLIKAYINYSQLLVEHHSFNKALKYSILAENILVRKKTTNFYLLGSVYQNRSIIYQYLGQVNKAYLYLDKAERILSIRLSNDNPILNRVRLNLAVYYFKINKIDDALRQLELVQEFNDPSFILLLNTLKSKCYIEINKYALAEKYLKKSICQLRSFGLLDSHLASYVYLTYSNYLKGINKTLESEETILFAIDIQNRNRNKFSFYDIIVFNDAGHYYYETKDFVKAISFYQQGIFRFHNSRNDSTLYPLNIFIFFDDSYRLAKSYEGIAKSYLELFKQSRSSILNLIKSKKAIDKAIEIISTNQIQNNSNISIFPYITAETSIYNSAMEIYYELIIRDENLEYKYAAFKIIENSKSTNLRNSINTLAALEYSNIPQNLISQESRYKSLLRFYNQKICNLKLDANENGVELLKYKDLRFTAMKKYDSLIYHFEEQYPDYYSLRYSSHNASINEIQSQLDENSTLLNYLLSDSVLIIGIVSSEDFNIIKVNIDSTLEQTSKKVFQMIKTGGTKQEIIQYSHDLYNTLIKPIYSHICNKSKLVIIPDGSLYYVPFELLIRESIGNNENIDFTTLNYLINEYSISYHYSASLWARTKSEVLESDFTSKRSFLGVAPSFLTTDSLKENLKNSSANRQHGITLRSLPSTSKTFSDLPYARKEVRHISSLFNQKGFEIKLLLDSLASESNFKRSVKNVDYIHIATHGFSNDENPELSGLAMYPIQKSHNLDTVGPHSIYSDLNSLLESSNDDILYAGEMFNLDLNAELMVLSACESGVGQVVKGEGMIALTRGLIYSGAKNIVYTLWKISDKHTEQFMIEFYTHVLSGSSNAEALRQAKLSMIRNSSTAFPKLWAGYMLIGE